MQGPQNGDGLQVVFALLMSAALSCAWQYAGLHCLRQHAPYMLLVVGSPATYRLNIGGCTGRFELLQVER